VLERANLRDAWACDASTYSSSMHGGHRFLLVGDAGSFIDPLSSFGVKKALASAWIAAVVVNTCLIDPQREAAALEFFESWERDVCATHARRSRDFAAEAAARHPQRFWLERASIDAGAFADDGPRPDVAAALRAIRESRELDLEVDGRARFQKHAMIRDREIVLEDALSLPYDGTRMVSEPRPVRFVDNVDLIALATLASRHRQVPDLFDAYCRTIAPIPLPNVLGGLSLLVATGVLRQRNAIPC
jgi:hypothetical protein